MKCQQDQGKQILVEYGVLNNKHCDKVATLPGSYHKELFNWWDTKHTHPARSSRANKTEKNPALEITCFVPRNILNCTCWDLALLIEQWCNIGMLKCTYNYLYCLILNHLQFMSVLQGSLIFSTLQQSIQEVTKKWMTLNSASQIRKIITGTQDGSLHMPSWSQLPPVSQTGGPPNCALVLISLGNPTEKQEWKIPGLRGLKPQIIPSCLCYTKACSFLFKPPQSHGAMK